VQHFTQVVVVVKETLLQLLEVLVVVVMEFLEPQQVEVELLTLEAAAVDQVLLVVQVDLE
jgi:hypothetical protein